MNRLVAPTAGEEYLDGTPTSVIDPLALRRRVGMVFQLPALFGETVEETVLYGARLAGKDTDADRLLGTVGLDASSWTRSSRSPSGSYSSRKGGARQPG